MKKSTFLLSLFMSAGVTSVMAEGYQVNLLSAKQAGMGHTGVALKLGAESMHFNPAGMAFMEETADFSAGISGVFSEVKWSHDGNHAKTHNDAGTPLYAYAGFKVYDNFKIGVSFTTPYGNGIKWPKNWVGATLVQDISLKSYVMQPTLSYKILDNLSIGAGLMLAWGDFSMSKGLMPASDAFGGVVPVSVRLTGESKVKLGVNVGAMYDINEKVTVGASFRSRMMMKVSEGNASLDYASDAIKNIIAQTPGLNAISKLDEGTFHSELPLPSNLTVGVSYKPIKPLLLALDVQMVGWKAYDVLEIGFNESVLSSFDQKLVKNYKHVCAIRLGAQYETTDRLDLRAGIYFDQSPVDNNFYNPETPGMDKMGFSIGASFRPFEGFSIDFSALYITGFSRHGSYEPYTIDKSTKFEGKYSSSAFCPTIGLSYKF